MLAALLALFLAAPTVEKVEPPSWWTGSTLPAVRLLVRGQNLRGVRVQGAPGVAVVSARANEAGTYAFVDVRIDPAAAAGPRRLALTTAEGSAVVPFEVRPPLAREGRFQGFSPDDVIYLIMPDRFADGDPSNDDPAVSRGLYDRTKRRYYHGGDLAGIADHLAYLKDLGMTALWLTPVYDNVNHLNERERYDGEAITDYHGYGAVDFYAVDEHLGDLAQYRAMVDAAHRLGLKVVQDQVANHTGPYHPWVTHPPTPTWFNGTADRHLANTWQTWTLADPHASADLRRETLQGWFIDILPDLDQDDPEVARYLIQNALWWVGVSGVDAIRQDTLPYVPRAFWHEWSASLKREFPHLTILGEMADGDPSLVSFFQGGRVEDGVDTGIDTLFDYPLFFPIRRAFGEGKPLREVAAMIGHDRLYRDASLLVTFAGLHDNPRFMNESGATVDGLKLAHAFLMTVRGTPLVYYGDEIALPGGGDPDNRRDFPGGFPGDPRNAFEARGRSPEEQEAWLNLRTMARLRATLEPLRRGRQVDLAAGEQTYAFARVGEREAALVAFNNATAPAVVDVPAGPLGWKENTPLADRLGHAAAVRVIDGRIRMSLLPRSAAVFTPQER